MKQTIFGIILGVLLVQTMFVGLEMKNKYEIMNSSEYKKSTEFTVDIDGIKYRKDI